MSGGLTNQQKFFGHDLAEVPSVVRKQVNFYRAYDATSQLQNLGDIRTVVIIGDQDPIGPSKLGQALANGIANAHFHMCASGPSEAPNLAWCLATKAKCGI